MASPWVPVIWSITGSGVPLGQLCQSAGTEAPLDKQEQARLDPLPERVQEQREAAERLRAEIRDAQRPVDVAKEVLAGAREHLRRLRGGKSN